MAMIEVDPLLPFLEAVEKAWELFDGLGKQNDAATSDRERDSFTEPLRLAESAYYAACSQLAITVAYQIKAAKAVS